VRERMRESESVDRRECVKLLDWDARRRKKRGIMKKSRLFM
jgi:hypothetical protein